MLPPHDVCGRRGLCPSDGAKTRATVFNPTGAGGTTVIVFDNVNYLSYFAGLDASETEPQTILSGDRNVSKTSWTQADLGNVTGQFDRNIHNDQGNIGLADGSAQQVNSAGLRKLVEGHLRSTGGDCNLAVP